MIGFSPHFIYIYIHKSLVRQPVSIRWGRLIASIDAFITVGNVQELILIGMLLETIKPEYYLS